MDNQSFNYTYSAKEQAEVKRIRDKYIPREEDPMERLRRLDASVTEKGSVAALVVGILSALVLGVGMCCCLVWDLFLWGIIIGAVGIVGVSLAYPLHQYVVQKERQKIAPEILRLTDELMK
ncbi:MAG: hypothetical protein IJ333_09955 [Clostridia bacterium]|nr:hypothetical protein [Clostridia bacterium]